MLEVGCGPGTGIAEVPAHGAGSVCGIDPSAAMLEQAGKLNAAPLADRRLDLRRAVASNLPVDDGIFDAAFAVNSLQLWPDAVAGLREIRRCLRPEGRIAVGFTANAGRLPHEADLLLHDAGFEAIQTLRRRRDCCTLAIKPRP